jgi:ubiquinone biosynthesis protein Coq4
MKGLRPRSIAVDLTELRALPEGTLGRAYAAYVDAALEGDAPPDVLETHDVHHVLTGFARDVAGDLGLMAFYCAQSPSKIPVALLAAGLLDLIFNMDDKEARLDAIARGWLLGRRARSLSGVRWSELWALPLHEVRGRFGVDDGARP